MNDLKWAEALANGVIAKEKCTTCKRLGNFCNCLNKSNIKLSPEFCNRATNLKSKYYSSKWSKEGYTYTLTYNNNNFIVREIKEGIICTINGVFVSIRRGKPHFIDSILDNLKPNNAKKVLERQGVKLGETHI